MSCSCGCENKAAALLKSELTVVNFGMESFYNDLKSQSVPVVQVDWKPPAAGGDLLSKLKKLKKGGD
jgi:FdrA protein